MPSDLSLCLCLLHKLTDKHSTNQLPIENKLLRHLCMTQIHLTKLNMIVPKRRGPQYRPQNTIVLIRGTPKKVPLILGNPPHIPVAKPRSTASSHGSQNINRRAWQAYGWLSKLWALFGYPKYKVPYYNKDPKRDHNFDNQPYKSGRGKT